jgi:hypothetical protein
MAKSTCGNTSTATDWDGLEEGLAESTVHERHGPAVPLRSRDAASEAARQASAQVAPRLSDVCDVKAAAVIVGHDLGSGWPVNDAQSAAPGCASGSRPRGTARP